MPEDKDKVQQPEGTAEPEPQEEPTGKSKESPQGSDGGNGEVERLKAIIAGLNRTISKKDNEIAQLKERLEQLEDALAEANRKLEELGEKAQKADEAQAKIENLERALRRKSVVLSEFPELAQLEASGLLDNIVADDEEELKEALAKMHQTVVGLAKKIAANEMSGVTPEPSGTEAVPETEEGLIEAAMKAIRQDDTEAYERYMSLLEKLG